MKVILTERVTSLGNVGEVVNVSEGYARNFLIPKNLGVLADEKNTKAMEFQKKRLAKRIAEEKSAAEGVKGKIDGLTLELVKKVGSNGKLFGSVTNADLAKELNDRHGVELERRILVIDNPIKALGSYSVKAKLFSEVEANFNVKVVMDPAQAEELKAKQAAAEKRAKAKKEAAANAPEEGAEAATEEATEETTEA